MTLVVIAPARAWHHLTTHRAINARAIELFETKFGSTAKYDRSPLLLDFACNGPAVTSPGREFITEGDLTLSVKSWIREGGYYADEPEWAAAWRHFYDPVRANGVYYLTEGVPDWGVNPQIDAKTLALTEAENAFNWSRALEYYRLAMEQETDRELNLARALRALGQTMHLVADMAQPAHVRNDAHAFDEPVEDTVRISAVNSYGLNDPDPDVRITDQTLPQLFDNVSTFVNERFYSSDTIYDQPSGVNPRTGEAAYARPQFANLAYVAGERAYYGSFALGQIPMAQEALTVRMVQRGYMQVDREIVSEGWHVPAAYADDQAKVLLPIAVHACAETMNLFFPTIDLTIELADASGGQVNVSGRMVHQIGSDREWSRLNLQPLMYTGSGELMRQGNGTAERLAEVTFTNGVMDTARVTLESDDEVFLKVIAGGRRFVSETARPSSGPGQQTFTFTASDTVAVANCSGCPPCALTLERAADISVAVSWDGVQSPEFEQDSQYSHVRNLRVWNVTYPVQVGGTFSYTVSPTECRYTRDDYPEYYWIYRLANSRFQYPSEIRGTAGSSSNTVTTAVAAAGGSFQTTLHDLNDWTSVHTTPVLEYEVAMYSAYTDAEIGTREAQTYELAAITPAFVLKVYDLSLP